MKLKEFYSSTYATVSRNSLPCGRALQDSSPSQLEVRLPLSKLNRHCLIAGSTGTGKSRSAQLLAEQLSLSGVPVLFTDVKGDVSGFSSPGDPSQVDARCSELSYPFSPSPFPSHYWSLSSRLTPIRLRLDEINPALLAKFMGLNPTQESHLAVILPYAKKRNLAVVDLEDLSSLLEFLRLNSDEIPGLSPSTLDVLLRKCAELSASGLNSLFSPNPLDPQDLLQKDEKGRGLIHILNLSDYRDRPDVFSAATAFLLNKLFTSLPDVGDEEKPRLAVFFDEAHYLFINANRSLVDLMTTILRQIRSKGVAVFFLTQEPGDISEGVLGQLANKIQFALRAFTQKDLDEIRAISKGFPPSSLYNLQEELKTLPVATSLCSFLSEKGELLPPIKVAWYPPSSSMGIASNEAMLSVSRNSPLFKKYSQKAKKGRLAILTPAPAARAEAARPRKAAAREEPRPPGLLSFLGMLAKRLVGFIGFVLDKFIKGLLNFIGWLMHKLLFAPLTGIFHTLTFGIFRKRRRRR